MLENELPMPKFAGQLVEVRKKIETLEDQNPLKAPAVFFLEALAAGTPLKKVSNKLGALFEPSIGKKSRVGLLYERMWAEFPLLLGGLPKSLEDLRKALIVSHADLKAESYKRRKIKREDADKKRREARMTVAVAKLIDLYDAVKLNHRDGAQMWYPSQAWLKEVDPGLFDELNKAQQSYRVEGSTGWNRVMQTLRQVGRNDIAELWSEPNEIEKERRRLAGEITTLYHSLRALAQGQPIELTPSVLKKYFGTTWYRTFLRLVRNNDGTVDPSLVFGLTDVRVESVWFRTESPSRDSSETKERKRREIANKIAENLEREFGRPESLSEKIPYKTARTAPGLESLFRSAFSTFIVDGQFSFRLLRTYLPPEWQEKIIPPR